MCDDINEVVDSLRSPEYKRPVLMFPPTDPAAKRRDEFLFHQARGDPGYPPAIQPPRDAACIYQEFLRKTGKKKDNI
jgi:hypothetical protein